MSNQKISAVIGRIKKSFHKRFLCLLVKIDHNISAENNVKFQTELDRVHQIKGTEDDVISEILGYMVRSGRLSGAEIFLFPGRGQFFQRILVIDCIYRAPQYIL